MQQRTTPQTPAATTGRDPRPVDIATMRETVRRLYAYGVTESSPLEDLDDITEALRGHVRLMVPELRALVRSQPAGDVTAQIAEVGADEAWRRLNTTPGFGPDAAYRRARKLAMSVQSLCDHYETLNPPAH
ncbi:DUF6415 family natural product biosynthesis protein [Streptomyces sp. NPDC048389]|uniref:DUF6415 family natural product biosynthesis protein n=1 Tax=Streptomyces sp. NPDC048389 TaxID=3154622 RepID=UPI00345334FA